MSVLSYNTGGAVKEPSCNRLTQKQVATSAGLLSICSRRVRGDLHAQRGEDFQTEAENPPHIKQRLQVAQEVLGWKAEQWKKIIFPDELTIYLLDTSGKLFPSIKKGDCYSTIVPEPSIIQRQLVENLCVFQHEIEQC